MTPAATSSPFPTDWSSWGPSSVEERRRAQYREIPKRPAETGLVVEDTASGWVGAVLGVEAAGGMHVVRLEDRHGRTRSFPLGHGFLCEGEPVELIAPTPGAGTTRAGTAQSGTARSGTARRRTASGSLAVDGARARTARASRIWVEGLHDAELIEKVWGEDLSLEGVVVEPLHGADDLTGALAEFEPSAQRRVGVLLDHLVPGSKESRIAEAAMRSPGARGNVLILGHPYVDVWQAVRPERLGLQAWPQVPRGTDIKVGTLQALGWPHRTRADIAQGWRRILGSVRSYADLEASLLGRVEELIDFVTAG